MAYKHKEKMYKDRHIKGLYVIKLRKLGNSDQTGDLHKIYQ